MLACLLTYLLPAAGGVPSLPTPSSTREPAGEAEEVRARARDRARDRDRDRDTHGIGLRLILSIQAEEVRHSPIGWP